MIDLQIKGLDKFARSLKKYGKVRLGKGIENGFVKAGLMLMRESQKIVPVQLGTLKASAFVSKKHKGLKTIVTVGYASGPQSKHGKSVTGGKNEAYAPYAYYVHEIPNPPHAHGAEFNIKHADEIARAKGTWLGTAEGGMFNRKPEEQYKFLERPIREKRKDIFKIIRHEVKRTVK